ncbi:MAG: ring-cleaving dioxygenase [Chitinophagaceae bacterium]|nr:ring-cleaving dioxygenase [Chitinophagaceae bacterium]
MSNRIKGLHHITAIAGDAKRNYDFYTRVLGLRLVKKTVNFDDPETYHFYYGNENGSPGTILTFFPWANVRKGRNGSGMATEIGYSVPTGSLEFWRQRFEQENITHGEITTLFNEQYLPFEDPDGLNLTLIVSAETDERAPWETDQVKQTVAIKGFYNVTLTLRSIKPTATVLTEIFGYSFVGQEGNRYRYKTDAIDTASIIDLIEAPMEANGLGAGGTNHHVAFRVENEEVLMEFREKIVKRGFQITQKIDRNYFYSLYFREPGGVLFELATDNPGFATDETIQELGSGLRLPAQYESIRSKLETILPSLV